MSDDLITKLRKIGNFIKILYVEDNEVIAEQLEKLLKKVFKFIDVAHNGKEGLELYRQNEYDIVITDIAMPVMDGLEMIRQIKAINPEQITVITSAHNDTNYLTDMIELDVDKFIMKPIDMHSFFKTIAKLVANVYNEKRKAQLEQQLLEQAEENQKIIEHMPAPVLVMDHGLITYANERFMDHFGLGNDKKLLPSLGLGAFIDEKRVSMMDNLTLAVQLEEEYGSVLPLLLPGVPHPQRFKVMVTSLDEDQKRLICFFNVEQTSLQLENLEKITIQDPVTGLTLRRAFIQDLERVFNDDKHHTIVCFGLKHIDRFIRSFGVKSTPQIYAKFAQNLKHVFDEEFKTGNFKLAKFGTNKFILLIESQSVEEARNVLQSFGEEYGYANEMRSVREAYFIDFICLPVDKTLSPKKVLDDIENHFYMLKGSYG